MMNHSTILSRHRLRQPYRALMVGLWVMPAGLLWLALLLGRGFSLHLLDPRLLAPLLLMLLPALYVWQEGIDTHTDGLTLRLHIPQFYAYEALAGWRLEDHHEGQILKVWDARQLPVLSIHAAHLSRVSLLLTTLEQHLNAPQMEVKKRR